MEVNFPTSRESFRRHSGYDFPYSTDDERSKNEMQSVMEEEEGSSPQHDSSDVVISDDDDSDSDGFLGWPSGRSSSSSSSSMVEDNTNNGNDEQTTTRLGETPSPVEEQKNDHYADSSANGGNDNSLGWPSGRSSSSSSSISMVEENTNNGNDEQTTTRLGETPSPAEEQNNHHDADGSANGGDDDSSDDKMATVTSIASSGHNYGGQGGDDDGDSSDNDSSTMANSNSSAAAADAVADAAADNSSSAAAVDILQRQSSLKSMGSSDAANSSPTKRRGDLVHLSRSTNSRSTLSSGGEGRHRHSTLETINSQKSFRNSMRRNSELRRSLRKSFAEQSSLRKSMQQKEKVEEQEQKEKGEEQTAPIKPLTQSHDENAIALPIIGWDKVRQSVRNSLAKQQSSLRKSTEQKEIGGEEQITQEPMKPPSLNQSHDANAIALPILGWDEDTDDDSDGGSSSSPHRRPSFCPSLLGKSGRSSAFGIGGMHKSKSSASVSSSLKASQQDSDGPKDGMVYEEFGRRGSFRSSALDRRPPNYSSPGNHKNNNNGSDLLMMMMEEEYDPRKPWRKAPPGGVVGGGAAAGDRRHPANRHHPQHEQEGRSKHRRRASGITTRSSFTSDVSFGELLLQELQQPLAPVPDSSLLATSDGAAASSGARKENEGGLLLSPMEEEEELTSSTHRHKVSDLTSALSDDDDCSELTELRQAHEVLFPVPESVTSTTPDDSERSDGSVNSEKRESQGVSTVTLAAGAAATRNKDLSSLDIVREEQPQLNNSRLQHLSPVEEQGGSDGEQTTEEMDRLELDDLPTSSFRRNSAQGIMGNNNKDDDSISYSDIDVEAGVTIPTTPPPSIKMCMTVRNSMIEREFSTLFVDVEYGETKPDEEMTLNMFLDPSGQRNDADDALYDTMMDDDDNQDHDDSILTRNDNSHNSDTNSTFRAGSTRKSLKKSVFSQTAKLDTKATKNLRRKNKRLWKFCVWNCRKITVCVVLGLCILAGIAALAWWGAREATEGGGGGNGGDDDLENVQVQVEEESGSGGANNEESSAPTGSGSKQWPPVTESGRIPPPIEGQGQPTQFPSFPPSSFVQNNVGDTLSSSPSSSSSSINANINTSTPIYSYTTPSFTPSESPSPSSSAISSVLNITSQNVSVHPSSSPYSNNASFIQSPSVNSTSAVSIYPSLSPSSEASAVEPTSTNTSSIEPPSMNSTSTASLYPSLSPSTNASYIEAPPMDDVSPVYESIQTISGMKEFEYAGASVSTNPTGEFIAVGFKEANGPVEKAGLVRVYQRTSDNMYSPFGLDSMFGRGTGDEFGSAVSISNDGKRVAVGARSSSLPDKPKNGEAKVFEYSEASNSWVQLGSSIQGMEEKDRLGFSISISGDGKRVAVGAPRGNGGTGSASIHEYNGLDWILFGDIVVSDGDGDRAGFSVSLSNDGDTLAVGAFTSSKGGLTSSGSVSVYELDSLSLVNQGQTLVGTTDGAQFGYAVSLSGDGRRLVVGSNGFHNGNMAETGLCEVYELRAQNWTRIGALVGNKENEKAGSHVAMSITGSVVSCSKSTFLDGDMKGAVTVLEENEAEWNVVDTIIASHENSTSFGESVSLSQDGKMLLVGAPSYNSSAGFFEIFIQS